MMKYFSILVAIAAVSLFVPASAQEPDRSEQASELPLTADNGDRLANHTVKLPGPIDALPGVVVAANPNGKITLVEFYDLNCPYCRAASTDIADMIGRDPQLRLVLVPFPVLGIPSIQAGRIELAVAKLGTPKQFYAFHHKIYAQRGPVDGNRAFDIARGLGLDAKKLIEVGNSDDITDQMKNHVQLGDELGLAATPSFIIGGVAVVGYPGPKHLKAMVDAMNTCGKVMCED
jgi:protein-disulfide isomerase